MHKFDRKGNWTPNNMQHAIEDGEFDIEKVKIKALGAGKRHVEIEGKLLRAKPGKSWKKPVVSIDRMPNQSPLVQCECGTFRPAFSVRDIRSCEDRALSKFGRAKAKPKLLNDHDILCSECLGLNRVRAGSPENLYERIKEQFDEYTDIQEARDYIEGLMSRRYLKPWNFTASDIAEVINVFEIGPTSHKEAFKNWNLDKDITYRSIGNIGRILTQLKMDGLYIKNPAPNAVAKHHLLMLYDAPQSVIDKHKGTVSDLV